MVHGLTFNTHWISVTQCEIVVTLALYPQASEMASFVQAKRDLGCKAPHVTVLEEGINSDNKCAREFWSLLGGKTTYRGTHKKHNFKKTNVNEIAFKHYMFSQSGGYEAGVVLHAHRLHS